MKNKEINLSCREFIEMTLIFIIILSFGVYSSYIEGKNYCHNNIDKKFIDSFKDGIKYGKSTDYIELDNTPHGFRLFFIRKDFSCSQFDKIYEDDFDRQTSCMEGNALNLFKEGKDVGSIGWSLDYSGKKLCIC